MNIDELLKQVDYHNKSYEWIVMESEKIATELKVLDLKKDFDAEGYEKCSKQLMELQLRFDNNRKQYRDTVKKIRSYFKTKYDIDIVGILNDDVDAK